MSDSGSGIPMQQSLPTGWDAARLHRLLFRALATLAAQGWVVAPHDLPDLVQSFLAELWGELLSKWEADRSSFATYVYNQFVWFAKSWLQDERRFQQKQVDIDALRESWHPSVREVAEQEELTELIKDALGHLPRTTRAILTSYLSADRPSERALAKKYAKTRHDIRNHLVEGIGRILVEFPRPTDTSVEDWNVLLCLYGRGLTVAETSQLLQRDVSVVQQIRSGLLSRLARSIRR